jgi:hypothetical protein
MDVDMVEPGVDFVSVIEEVVGGILYRVMDRRRLITVCI